MFTREPEHQASTAEPRPRRWRFWLLLVGLPVLFVVLAVVGWMASASNGLQQVTAELDAHDPNWRLEDLENARATPPPGQNAAERVIATKRLLPLNRSYYKQDELLSNLDPRAQLNEQQVAALRTILQAIGPEALASARSLIDTPRGRHAIKWSPDFIGTILKCQDNREVVNLLRYDALDRAQAGDLGGAVAACHAGFHTGCSIGDEPMLISQLVRIAIQAVAVNMLERVLAQGEPPADRLAALQARLEAEEPAPLLLYGARGERAGGNQLFEYLRHNPGTVSGLLGLTRVTGAGGGGPDLVGVLSYVPGFLTMQHTGHLRYMNELVAIAERPPEEWEGLLAPMRAKVPQLPLLVRLLAPAMDKIAQACQRNHAFLRNAIVALAAERFRQQTGRWPTTLDELVRAKLLQAVPTDPYDSKPIRLKRTADGLIVYCVGPDGADNGGTIDRQNPVKVGTDLGFQLWDPPARRGPAPPPKPPDPSEDGSSPPPGAPPANPPAPPPAPPKP
jgi:hypothetical protein